MTYWTKEIFNTKKPIIAMCHLQAMPGDPGYDKAGGMKKVVEGAAKNCTPYRTAAWMALCSRTNSACPTC